MMHAAEAILEVAPPEAARVEAPHAPQHLTIAVINNMPDSALRATERQFCRLIDAAAQGMVVRLKFYAAPGLARSPEARAHIAEYYDSFDELEWDPPDGLIVTGAVPKAARLEDDPSYDAIGRLADWAVDASIPGIWSCLASHAAVLHLDGIERKRLPRKLSGLYECRFNRRRSQVLHNLPAGWKVPHSRYNGLSEQELVAHGYAILSRSSEAGVDLFCRRHGALQLFFQGHPEYEPDTLLREFRRDVHGFLSGNAEKMPAIPECCVPPETQSELLRLAAASHRTHNPHLMEAFDSVLHAAQPRNLWFGAARSIYVNWLSYLASRRLDAQCHTWIPATAARGASALP